MKKFTLIELLVVVAILGILCSILLPSLSKTREKGISVVCMNNLKNLGNGIHLYSAQNQKVPRGGWTPITWHNDIADQIGGLSPVFGCPSGVGGVINDWPIMSDYGYNAHANTSQDWGNSTFDSIESVNRLSETPIIHELVGQNNFPFWAFNHTLADSEQRQAFATRHIDKGNILFLDNHIESKGFMSYMNQAHEAGGAWDFILGR